MILTNKSWAERHFSSRLRQFYVALGPTLITISLGMAEGYSAILLPQLKNENEIEIDTELESWIASIAALPMPVACILGGYLMEVIGRKYVHMLCCFPCIFGWIMLYFANSSFLILFGRFVTGFCVGLLGPPTGVYMAETSDPKFRGFLLALISFAIATGIVLSHILGSFLSWRIVSLFSCIFPVLAYICMIFAPESPVFLAKKGRYAEAKVAFIWCRDEEDISVKEFDIMVERQKQILQNNTKEIKDYFYDIIKPQFYKPLFIMLLFFFTCQWCGSNAITFYNVTIINLLIPNKIDPYVCMIIIDIIRLISSIIACILLKKIGRRPLALISCTGCFLSLSSITLFSNISKTNLFLTENYYYIPLISLITYMIFLTVGLVPLPWTMTGEVFPQNSRGLGSGISALVNYAFIFSVVKPVPDMLVVLGTDGTFLVYSAVAMFGLVVLAKFLPETKNKPLHEIEDYFKGK